MRRREFITLPGSGPPALEVLLASSRGCRSDYVGHGFTITNWSNWSAPGSRAHTQRAMAGKDTTEVAHVKIMNARESHDEQEAHV
jgi:hypothetical protein